jgi:hypothetical protein
MGRKIPKHIKGERNEKRNRSKERHKEYFGFITTLKHACCPGKLEKIRKSVNNALLVMKLWPCDIRNQLAGLAIITRVILPLVTSIPSIFSAMNWPY